MVNLPIAAIKDVGAVVLMRLLAGCGVRRQLADLCIFDQSLGCFLRSIPGKLLRNPRSY